MNNLGLTFPGKPMRPSHFDATEVSTEILAECCACELLPQWAQPAQCTRTIHI